MITNTAYIQLWFVTLIPCPLAVLLNCTHIVHLCSLVTCSAHYKCICC